MKGRLVLAVLGLIILSCALTPGFRHDLSFRKVDQSSPGSDGLLYINPVNTTSLPAGSHFSVSVQASGVSYFDGWDVNIQTDPSVINATSFSITGDVFLTNYTSSSPPQPVVASECINGHIIQGGCGPFAGPGVAEFAVTFFGTPSVSPPLDGPVFNITYTVLTATGSSGIDFVNATLVNTQPNGSHTNLNIATQNGHYGQIVPGFAVTATPSSPTIVQGSSGTSVIDINSTASFTGFVNLSISGTQVPGLTFTFKNAGLDLKPNGSNSTTLVIEAGGNVSADLYTYTLLASSNTVSHAISLLVSVQTSAFFELQFIPTQLKIHEGFTANTTLLLQSEDGFYGLVNLTVAQPPVAGLIVQLSSTTINLTTSPLGSTTLMFVTTPLVALPFTYKINVTGTGVWKGITIHTIPQELIVKPPAVSMLVTLTPASITTRAGGSGNTVINVASVDYFWGFLSVSAIMSGGAVNFTSGINGAYYMPLAASANATVTPAINIGMTITVGSSTPPGNYVALLTVYSLATAYQGAYSTQVPVQVNVQAPAAHAANTVFGLPTPIYYGILGALAIPLITLSLLTIRRREKEDTSWRQ